MVVILTDVVNVIGFILLTTFVSIYGATKFWHSSRPGTALLIMAVGAEAILGVQMLRHPFDISTATSVLFAWVQAGFTFLFCIGVLWVTIELVLSIRRGRNDYWKRGE